MIILIVLQCYNIACNICSTSITYCNLVRKTRGNPDDDLIKDKKKNEKKKKKKVFKLYCHLVYVGISHGRPWCHHAAGHAAWRFPKKHRCAHKYDSGMQINKYLITQKEYTIGYIHTTPLFT